MPVNPGHFHKFVQVQQEINLHGRKFQYECAEESRGDDPEKTQSETLFFFAPDSVKMLLSGESTQYFHTVLSRLFVFCCKQQQEFCYQGGILCAVIYARADAAYAEIRVSPDFAEVRGRSRRPEPRFICGRNRCFPVFPAREPCFSRDVLWDAFSVRTGRSPGGRQPG